MHTAEFYKKENSDNNRSPEGVVEGLAQGGDENVHFLSLELGLGLRGQISTGLSHQQVRTADVSAEERRK